MAGNKTVSGVAAATAAASLFLSGCASMGGGSMDMAKADVHCAGINACKGQTACKSAMNDCKGKNSCKGKGWLPKANKADCEAAGGEVI
ncbi:MAG: hypothetical protein R3240_04445 [Gammaproteobacteria bacterium]|nr:hypothetical protein [Gammaproteobacteria bacterium]